MNTFRYPQGHALIVGIAAYHHIPQLPDVVLSDARDVAAVLGSPQYCGYDPANITQLIDDAATRRAVLAGLRDLADRTGPDDTACIYFSGHGALIKGTEESSLLTVDCVASDLSGTSISATELSDALYQIKARRLIIFLDACHAAGAGALKSATSIDRLDSGFSDKTLSRLVVGAGRALMASSRSSETSLIMGGACNSVFTAALLEGLRGAADRHEEGVIKVFDLFEYVAHQVPRLTDDAQHPIFKASQLEQNFPVALSRGGAKAPSLTSIEDGTDVNDAWQSLASILPVLYPSGPSDQEVWERAGGDVSRLRLHNSGRASWFSALKMLAQGGGGGGVSIYSLTDVVLEDFPNNPELINFQKTRR